jgi:hypothetical protein
MPDKNPDTHRWGGPGASHENRDSPEPKGGDPRAPGTPTNDRFSHVSGGGGERDAHHAHDRKDKRDFEDRHPRDERLQPRG